MSRIVTHQLVDARNGKVIYRRTMASTDFWSPFDIGLPGERPLSYNGDLMIQTSDGGAGNDWNWQPALVVFRDDLPFVTTTDAYSS